MSAFPSLPLFTDSFIADTGHLNAQETGAYLMLLMMAWRLPGGKVPDDDVKLSRWARVDYRTWHRIKSAVMEFWILTDGFWTQKRLSKELTRVSKFAEAARENGKHGGRPKSLENNNPINPVGLSSDTQSKAPNPNPILEEDANASLSETTSDQPAKQPPKRRKRGAYPPDFEAFWTGYPTDALMSKKAAGEVWPRMTEDEREATLKSLPAFRAYCSSKPDYRPVHANRYLSQERYKGFNEVAAKINSKVFVAKGSAAWDAWQQVKRTACVASAEHKEDGWWFESEWPLEEVLDRRKAG